jgi:MFS family permease
MVLAALGFGLVPSERAVVGFAILFGIGYGGVISTGWALAIDALPELGDVARDLGIWGIAQNLPGVLAPPFGYWLLARFGGGLIGYRALFVAAAVSFAIGSLAVLATKTQPGRTQREALG